MDVLFFSCSKETGLGAEKTNLVLNDRYKLIEKIGRGGMAEVWLAHDKTLERTANFSSLQRDLTEFISDFIDISRDFLPAAPLFRFPA